MVDKIKAADKGINDIKIIAGGKVIRTEDNKWKCTICEKIMEQGRSLTGHMGKHNRGQGNENQRKTKGTASNTRGTPKDKQAKLKIRCFLIVAPDGLIFSHRSSIGGSIFAICNRRSRL